MKITKFTIKRFKSIENIEIPIQSYGSGKNKSSVAIMVGINESGKSSILEAIDFFQKRFSGTNYLDNYHKGLDETDIIRVEADLEMETQYNYKNILPSKINISENFAEKIRIKSIKKITWQNEINDSSYYSLTIDSDLPFYEYFTTKENNTTRINSIREINGITEEITKANAKSFLQEGQVLLNKTNLEILLARELFSDFESDMPQIQIWKHKPEYLINGVISLDAFKDDTSISTPLTNIFNIAKYESDSKIKTAIERALMRPEDKAELSAKLSKSATSYINKIWKEHKINIIINIDGDSCSVHVEDKDKKHKYLRMEQRSDGFKQFISLILTLSTSHELNKLSDKIILIDEPEIHLHPSGVRYMRDELLKIGKNNSLIISTHSHYMIDTTTPERHFVVSKEEAKSTIKQIDGSTSMNDDKVLRNAFGLNLFKELLPQNIIVVEGGDDKAIISHCLKLLHKNFFYSIKSAGGTSKVYSLASILADEQIPAYFILDDDKDGRDAKNQILKFLKPSFAPDKVFTIKDISPSISEKSTIEDLLPHSFIKEFLDTEMQQVFTFDTKLPIIVQIKNQCELLKSDKDLLNSKKIKLSEMFIQRYDTEEKLKKEVKKLVALVDGIVSNMVTK